jgi:hypothetical protein
VCTTSTEPGSTPSASSWSLSSTGVLARGGIRQSELRPPGRAPDHDGSKAFGRCPRVSHCT